MTKLLTKAFEKASKLAEEALVDHKQGKTKITDLDCGSIIQRGDCL